MENVTSLCDVCSTLDFDTIRSSRGLELYPKAESLRFKGASVDACPLCALLWQRLSRRARLQASGTNPLLGRKQLSPNEQSEASKGKFARWSANMRRWRRERVEANDTDSGVETSDTDSVRVYAIPPPPVDVFGFMKLVRWYQGKPEIDDDFVPWDVNNPIFFPIEGLLILSGSREVLDKLVWASRGGSWELVEPGEKHNLAAREAEADVRRSLEHPVFVQQTLRVQSSSRAPLVERIKYRETCLDQASAETFAVIKSWLKSCLTSITSKSSHTACRHIQVGELPTRVIDVGPSDGSQEPHLVVTNNLEIGEVAQDPLSPDEENKKRQYICLSYCWGKTPGITTTSTNFEAHQKKIAFSNLPQTLKDAILITRNLGVRYLWIDALCIIQGSDAEALRDWQQESAKMNDIYSGALLTIAAASSTNVHDGIFSKQSPRSTDGCTIPFSSSLEHIPNVPLLVRERLPDFAPTLEEPLHARGWTLQERHISPRILYFNAQQISWECRSYKILESEPGKLHQSWHSESTTGRLPGREIAPGIHQINPYEVLVVSGDDREWGLIVEDYTSRSLSFQSDKLPAISGLAQMHQRRTGDEYLAGLWKSTFCDGLLWDHAPSCRYARKIPQGRPSGYRAPSWSWASVDGNVRYWGSLWPQGTRHRTKLLNHSITYASLNPFGQILEAKVTLRGPLKRARFERKYNTVALLDPLSSANIDSICLDISSSASSANDRLISETEPWCLLIWEKSAGLVVTPTKHREHEFRRLGTFQLRAGSYEWFADCEEQDLVLV